VERLGHRFLNRSAILTWGIRAAIAWVVSLPLVWRAMQVLAQSEGAAPAAFVAFFFTLVLAKVSLLVLLGRALDRDQCKRRVLSGYKAASH
jgi:hypothetical protein